MLSSLDTVVEEWITRHRTATLVDIARVVTLAVVAALVVVAVAWSRLELGAHWLTDTIAAWPLGLLAAVPLVYVMHARRRPA